MYVQLAKGRMCTNCGCDGRMDCQCVVTCTDHWAPCKNKQFLYVLKGQQTAHNMTAVREAMRSGNDEAITTDVVTGVQRTFSVQGRKGKLHMCY